MKNAIRWCQFFSSINRRHSLMIVSISFVIFLIPIELLLMADTPRSIRFMVLVDIPFRLLFALMLIYGAFGLVLKSWWKDKDLFEAFKQRDFDLVVLRDARLAGQFRRLVLVTFCIIETVVLIATGYLVCTVAVVLFQFDSFFAK